MVIQQSHSKEMRCGPIREIPVWLEIHTVEDQGRLRQVNTIHRCGAKYHGYMVGKHPIEKAGYVERVICFIEAKDTCECQYTATIGVQNCGGFYVYYFKGVPSPAVTSSDVLSLEDVSCSARYCMVANNSDSKLIIIYRYTPSYEHNGKLR